MEDRITAQPGILEIEPYVGGKGSMDGQANSVKLSSNENPLGASPSVRDAVVEIAGRTAVYPNSDHTDLRLGLAKAHQLDADRIVCGNGSDEIITFLCQAFAGEGEEVLFTEHGFSMYRICALAASATPVEVAENERVTDVDALIEGCTDQTRILFLANPNNPTGTFVSVSEIERLVDGVPSHVLVVLDGAYAEYVDGYDGGASLVESRENVVMTRTFSKVYGLGGLRLGWAYAPERVVDILHRVRGPFNVNSVALAAGLAAVQDTDYLAHCLAENAKARAVLANGLAKIGIPSDPSEGNFILARFTDEAEADAANEMLAQNGLIVRQVKGYGLPDCLRMTVGKMADCRRIISVLTDFKAGA